jgi:hypothetical protein
MPTEVDEQRVRRLLAQGKSQREIAQALKIPRTSLQRLIKTLYGSSSLHPLSSAPAISPPVVDTGTLSLTELDAVKADFWETITWWGDRKLKVVQASTPRDTHKQIYHVERRYIELIKHEAETEGVSITEVVNRTLRMYFERRLPVAEDIKTPRRSPRRLILPPSYLPWVKTARIGGRELKA